LGRKKRKIKKKAGWILLLIVSNFNPSDAWLWPLLLGFGADGRLFFFPPLLWYRLLVLCAIGPQTGGGISFIITLASLVGVFVFVLLCF
jgi:hypothetical protein